MGYRKEEVKCRACQGKGYLAGIKEFSCKKCLGTGRVIEEIEVENKINWKWIGIGASIILVVALLWWFL